MPVVEEKDDEPLCGGRWLRSGTGSGFCRVWRGALDCWLWLCRFLRLLKRESDDGPALALIEDFEVFLLEVAHCVTMSVAHHHRHEYGIGVDLEYRAFGWRGIRWWRSS